MKHILICDNLESAKKALKKSKAGSVAVFYGHGNRPSLISSVDSEPQRLSQNSIEEVINSLSGAPVEIKDRRKDKTVREVDRLARRST